MRAKCPNCQRDPELRKRWGCDAPAEKAVLRITCPKCNGSNRECVACKGSGFQPLYRCPSSHCTPEVSDVLLAFDLIESGHMPNGPRLLDQTGAFLAAVRVIGAERAHIDALNRQETTHPKP